MDKSTELAVWLAESQTLSASVLKLEGDLLALRARRMAVVKTIFDQFGKGPFEIDGEPYVIMVRPGKNSAESGYFLQRKLLPKPKTAPAP